MGRWGRIIGGIVLLGLGVVAVAGGGFALTAEQGIRTVDSAADGRVNGGPVSFSAEDARYGIVLFSGGTETEANNTLCRVTLANEDVKEIRGDIQAIGVSGRGESVGEFTAQPGRTRVNCRFRTFNDTSQQFAVSKIRTEVRTIALVVLGFGVVALLAGIGLILWGALRTGMGGRSYPAPPR